MNTKSKTDKTASASQNCAPLERLRHHVTGAIERGEAEPIIEQTAQSKPELPHTTAAEIEKACRDIETWRQAQHSPLPLHLEQANGQTTIYDAKLNVLFRVDGRHFDALNPIVASVNHAEALAEALRAAIERTRFINGGAKVDNQNLCKLQREMQEALANWEGAK